MPDWCLMDSLALSRLLKIFITASSYTGMIEFTSAMFFVSFSFEPMMGFFSYTIYIHKIVQWSHSKNMLLFSSNFKHFESNNWTFFNQFSDVLNNVNNFFKRQIIPIVSSLMKNTTNFHNKIDCCQLIRAPVLNQRKAHTKIPHICWWRKKCRSIVIGFVFAKNWICSGLCSFVVCVCVYVQIHGNNPLWIRMLNPLFMFLLLLLLLLLSWLCMCAKMGRWCEKNIRVEMPYFWFISCVNCRSNAMPKCFYWRCACVIICDTCKTGHNEGNGCQFHLRWIQKHTKQILVFCYRFHFASGAM